MRTTFSDIENARLSDGGAVVDATPDSSTVDAGKDFALHNLNLVEHRALIKFLEHPNPGSQEGTGDWLKYELERQPLVRLLTVILQTDEWRALRMLQEQLAPLSCTAHPGVYNMFAVRAFLKGAANA